MTFRLSLNLRIPPMGKARPRVAGGVAFMPKEYKVWIQTVRFLARSQIAGEARALIPYAGRLSCSVIFSVPGGEMRPDLDNAIGALWDALQVPPTKRGHGKRRKLSVCAPAWGVMCNDKQIRRIHMTEVVSGPTCIYLTLEGY